MIRFLTDRARKGIIKLETKEKKLCSDPDCPTGEEARGTGLCKPCQFEAWLESRPMCKVPDCGEKSQYNETGYCPTHHSRWRRGVDIFAPIKKRRNIKHVVEDAKWLSGTDNPENIAVRLGYTNWSTLKDALDRVGESKLVSAIAERRELDRWGELVA